MALDKIIVLILGVAGIAVTYWFFFLKNEKNTLAKGIEDIIVDGGYYPDSITIPYGKITTLRFFRKDSNSCLEDVVLADFKIKKYLPMNKSVEIEIIPQKKGVFSFTCGMGMFHGKLIVA